MACGGELIECEVAEFDPVLEFGGHRSGGALNGLKEGFECRDTGRPIGVAPCETAVAAAYFQHVSSSEVGQVEQGSGLVAFWINLDGHLVYLVSAA